MMPGINGLELQEVLTLEGNFTPIIFLSGAGTPHIAVEAFKFGAMDFLEKPAPIQELMEKIEHAKANRMLIVEQQMGERLKDILGTKGW
jgi:FixJ family two-component response regulator